MRENRVISKLPSKAERHRLFGSVDPTPGDKPTLKEHMSDLQNEQRNYLFDIEQVGIARVKHPITVEAGLAPATQVSIGTFKLTTSLNRGAKGINMSRLTEHLEEYRQQGGTTDLAQLVRFAKGLTARMNQERAELELSFPWFYERRSPMLGKTGLNHAEGLIRISYEEGRESRVVVGLTVAVTTLCPCSKEISEYSAHNQRGVVTMEARIDELDMEQDWKVMLLNAAESNASAPLHPILKRPDEKAVTEKAYENPRFVEDMVRLIAADLVELKAVRAFTVECRNEESIHLHDAIAKISYKKPRS
ncbi:GTP cyclohydrolase FolE2 [Paenibacillus peoriae]|uniref:GTP cyclohydrolase FolE2 n=1 Tax=Paenibacillus peoriae TaxID=59893 RepID=UPI00026C653D|nr:GTP cyclohydrolase FolE2 [Paenibacillus peoriae]MEC0180985.1 GTP cyclohydrolase FolE2 [Paenibacillus peoriae]